MSLICLQEVEPSAKLPIISSIQKYPRECTSHPNKKPTDWTCWSLFSTNKFPIFSNTPYVCFACPPPFLTFWLFNCKTVSNTTAFFCMSPFVVYPSVSFLSFVPETQTQPFQVPLAFPECCKIYVLHPFPLSHPTLLSPCFS